MRNYDVVLCRRGHIHAVKQAAQVEPGYVRENIGQVELG